MLEKIAVSDRAFRGLHIVIPKSPFVFISVFGITILSTGSGPPGGTTNSYPPKNTVKPKVCRKRRLHPVLLREE